MTEQLSPANKISPKTFNPEEHLRFQDAPESLSMHDIGMAGLGISPVAVSEPFPLFSEEAIQHMRKEIFTQEVWNNCMFSSDFAACQLRGHCPK